MLYIGTLVYISINLRTSYRARLIRLHLPSTRSATESPTGTNEYYVNILNLSDAHLSPECGQTSRVNFPYIYTCDAPYWKLLAWLRDYCHFRVERPWGISLTTQDVLYVLHGYLAHSYDSHVDYNFLAHD